MSEAPPRPSRRPTRNNTFDKATETVSQNGSDSNAQDQKQESVPPPRPSSRPIRIQPADPEAPQFKAKSDLHQRLEKLDTPNAASDPEAVRLFEEVKEKLETEGPGGLTAAALKFPVLGPQKTFGSEKPLSTETSSDLPIEKSIETPVRESNTGKDAPKMEIKAVELEPESHKDVKGPETIKPSGQTTETSKSPQVETPSESDTTRTIDSKAPSKTDRSEFEKEPEPNVDHTETPIELSGKKLEEKEPVVSEEIKEAPILGGTKAEDPESRELPQSGTKAEADSTSKDIAIEKEQAADPVKESRQSEAEAPKADEITMRDIVESDISPKTSIAQGSLEDLLPSPAANKVDNSKESSEKAADVVAEPTETLPPTAEKSTDSVAKPDTELNSVVAPIQPGGPKDTTIRDAQPEPEPEPKDAQSEKSNPAVKVPPARPSKPLAPKPKSALASRFEAALRENEESKPKLAPKPKPRLSGSNGRIAALQASMFADLNAALSRGPMLGGKPRGSREEEGPISNDSESEPMEKEAKASQPQDSAEDQIKAMPKLPGSRASGPNRRRKLPEIAKPRFTIISPRKPLWEIPQPISLRVSERGSTASSPPDAGSNESDIDRPMGNRTELNLRDALVRSLSRSDKSSDGHSERSDSVTQDRGASVFSASSLNDVDSADEDIMSHFTKPGLPSLGSLVDQDPSPVDTPIAGHKIGRADEDGNKSTESETKGDSGGLLGLSLSQYLDKTPQTPEATRKNDNMKASGSYFFSDTDHPKESSSESEELKTNEPAEDSGLNPITKFSLDSAESKKVESVSTEGQESRAVSKDPTLLVNEDTNENTSTILDE